jgi:hypothetical protein
MQIPRSHHWLAAVLLLVLPLAAAAQLSDAELMQRMQELSRRAQACGADPACLQQVQNELQQLNQEYQRAHPSAEPTPMPTPEQRARVTQVDDAVRQMLSGRRDDPCYVIFFQKETARRLHGSDLPWLQCIPAQVQVRWQLHESELLQKYQADYTVEETYPAYFETQYDQQQHQRVVGYHLVGPAPQDRAEAQARIVAGQASIMGVRYHGILSPTPSEQKQFGTSSTADFRSERLHRAAIDFQYSTQGPGGAVIVQQLRLAGSDTHVRIQRGGADVGADFQDPLIQANGAAAFTLDEIRKGLRTGTLTKTFTVNFTFASVRQTGQATVTVIFNRQPGMLAVAPTETFRATGPDRQGHFAPDTVDYTLRNTGEAPLSWSAGTKAPWLDVSPGSGKLAPGTKGTVQARINSKAKTLAEGTHKTQIAFTNLTDGRGSTSREAVLEVGEIQVWRVRLTGRYEYSSRTVREVYDPGASRPHAVNDIQTVWFDYNLGAEFTLKKKKGQWIYDGGNITASSIKHGYKQQPKNLWQVLAIRCLRCDEVSKLKGQALPGQVSGKDVMLFWPVVRPALEVDAKLAVKCQANPTDPGACKSAARGGTAYYEDDVFLTTTHAHFLPLRDGAVPIKPDDHQTAGYRRILTYHYQLKRLR